MSDYSLIQENAAWDRVAAASAAAGVLAALKQDHRPRMAERLEECLQALGFAVHRGVLDRYDAAHLLTTSADEADTCRITSLEEFLRAAATPLHQRHPKLRPLPFIPEAHLPLGCAFFPARTDFWTVLHNFIAACAPRPVRVVAANGHPHRPHHAAHAA